MEASIEKVDYISYLYDRPWKVHVNKSEEKTAMYKWFNENITDILVVVKTTQIDPKQFSILSVGCSEGDKDMIILKHLENLLRKEEEIHFTAVEPSSSALKEFENNISQTIRQITFRKQEMTFEKFSSLPEKEGNSFDFVILIHCIYYMNAEESLVHCFNNELKENGAILCMVEETDSGFAFLQPKLQDSELSKERNKHAILYTTEDIIKIAEKYGWKYRLSKYIYEIDITECFDESSENGNLLLDFLVHVPDFRKRASRALYKDIMDELRKQTVEKSNGKNVFLDKVGVMIIFKNQ